MFQLFSDIWLYLKIGTPKVFHDVILEHEKMVKDANEVFSNNFYSNIT